MEPWDLELIQKLVRHDEELKLLMEEHQALEQELETYISKRHLTPSEELKKKQIKKLKLAGRDRIEAILSRYRRRAREEQAR